jgi:hypothetical protein
MIDASSDELGSDHVQKALLVLVFLVVLYTGYFSSSKSKETGRPAVVPSWIPWLGSALTMGMDPDGFLLRNTWDTQPSFLTCNLRENAERDLSRRKYGPAFFVDVIGLRFLYITAREPIKWALRKPKDIAIRGVEYDSLQSIFDLSEDAAAAETTHGTAFKILSRSACSFIQL